MKFKFSTTIVVQVSGEAVGHADQLDVFTEESMKIMPAFMTAVSDGNIEALPPDEQKLIFAIIANNVLNRAAAASRITGVQASGPVPAVVDTPQGERN